MSLSQEISNWIEKQVKNANKKGIVLGLSGGIDSSVVAVLSKKALGDNVLGLLLPCNSSNIDERLATELANTSNIKTRKIDSSGLFNQLININPKANDLAKANLKPRLRMLILYYFANSLDYLVAGTGNKSEIMTGYFTKHGDGGCDVLPLGGLLKTEVKSLARELNLPSEIIKRPPTAGLWEGQTDESEMAITYKDLDKCLIAIESKTFKNLKESDLKRVRLMIKKSHHKRKRIPMFYF
ncbi:NAD(+) synthase [bacterium]|nr:NAD(+) synthase [bacterium]